MTILGLNAYYAGSSAALLRNGQLAAAMEEERLNRIPNWAGVPVRSAAECLKHIDLGEVAHVALSHRPGGHTARRILAALRGGGTISAGCPDGTGLLSSGSTLEELRVFLPRRAQFHEVEHQRAHMAGAFFASPFEEATIVSADGFGDFSSLMWGTGHGSRMRVHGGVQFPHSLGIFLTAFAQFLGFPGYGQESELTGLAAAGEPRYAEQVRQVVRAEGASCRLNLDYFTHHRRGVETTWSGGRPELRRVFSEKMVETFGPARMPESEILPKHADLAASVQLVFEERYFSILNAIFRRTRHRNLCLAGTVALNSVANGKVFENTPFEQVFVHPAPHDAGTSIGAALYVQHQVLGEPRGFVLRHLYYGPEYGEFEIRQLLRAHGLPHLQIHEEDLACQVAQELADGKIVGWFQGRSEFGRHALGNRSLLADPSRPELRTLLAQGRARESFRPLCASTTAEAASEYFEVSHRSPFMTMACRIRPEYRQPLAALDGTVGLQTVEQDVNPLYWSLIGAFGEITGTPVLANTVFESDDAAVNTPQQALDGFLSTPMDVLVLGRFLLTKAEGVSGGRTVTRAANAYGS